MSLYDIWIDERYIHGIYLQNENKHLHKTSLNSCINKYEQTQDGVDLNLPTTSKLQVLIYF